VSVSFEIVEHPARACAALMVGAATRGGSIVLAGGSTPRAAYEHFVRAVTSVGVELAQTTFWIGDERCVAPDDDRSNYKLIHGALIAPLAGVTPVHVERIHGELGPEAGAEDYEQRLRAAGPPTFDLVLLGIGPDGHTASLFPEQASLFAEDRLAIGVTEAGLEPFVPRVSLTLPALVAARHVVVLAQGSAKADAIAQAFGAGAQPGPRIPASMLAPDATQLTVLIDPNAAAALDEPGVRR